VAISEARRRELADLTGLDPDAIAVIPDGVDVAALLRLEPATQALVAEAAMGDADPLLLMPARLVPRKNIELGLRLTAALRERGRPAGLVVTGPAGPHDGDERRYADGLLDLRDALGLRNAAWFPGVGTDAGLPDPVVADLYALADLLFLPSREEGFGIPVLEALVRRLPIVCSDLPPLREIAGDGALYIDPDDDPEALAARVLGHLAAQPALGMAAHARRAFAWQRIYDERIEPLLREVAAGSAGAGRTAR
jgi:glycosyltransferase involved in cell wall biosynthesis